MTTLLLDNDPEAVVREWAAVRDLTASHLRTARAHAGRADPAVGELVTGMAEQAIATGLSAVAAAERSWGRLLADLRGGMGGQRLRARVAPLPGLFDFAAELLDQAQEFARLAGANPTGAADLPAARGRLDTGRAALTKMIATLDAPVPPIDPAVLDAAAADMRHGRYRTADQIVAALRGSEQGG